MGTPRRILHGAASAVDAIFGPSCISEVAMVTVVTPGHPSVVIVLPEGTFRAKSGRTDWSVCVASLWARLAVRGR